jgi:hypothetical protein
MGKEPVMKDSAGNYKILRDCTLDTLIEDGNCFEAVKFYRKASFQTISKHFKLSVLFKEYPEMVEKAIPYLTDETLPKGAYLKKIERKPEPGEIWKLDGNLWFVAENEIMKSTAVKSTGWLCYCVADSDKTFMNFQANGWEYIGKLKDMLKKTEAE